MWCEVVINGFIVGFIKGVDYIQDVIVDICVEVINMYVGFVCQFFYCYDVFVG